MPLRALDSTGGRRSDGELRATIGIVLAATAPTSLRRPTPCFPHRGNTILVLGILGLIVCGPLGIAAWVMGKGDLAKIDAGLMDPTGRGTTQAGMVLGIIGTVLIIVQVGLGILIMASLPLILSGESGSASMVAG